MEFTVSRICGHLLVNTIKKGGGGERGFSFEPGVFH